MLHTGAYWLMLTVRDAIPRSQPLATVIMERGKEVTNLSTMPHRRQVHVAADPDLSPVAKLDLNQRLMLRRLSELNTILDRLQVW